MSVKVISIGRSEDNDIVLNNSSVSRKHAEIFVNDEEGLFILTDLDSTNGTYVNGKRINEPVMLKRRDIVKIGDAPPIPWKNFVLDISESPVVEEVVDSEEIEVKIEKDSNSRNAAYYTVGIIIILLLCLLLIYIFNNSTSSNNEFEDQEENGWFEEESDNSEENIETSMDELDENSSSVELAKDQPLPTDNAIIYDYDCLENNLLNDASDFESEIIDAIDVEVSLSEEREIGTQLYEGVKEEYKFVFDHRTDRLNRIKTDLVRQVSNPRGFSYSIYLIEEDEVNAFTAGGFIFVTTKMYGYASNDDELACIIGHEIAHNECGHIKQQLKKQKANSMFFGELFGTAADNLSYFLTAGFNQKKETQCDFYGIDYATRAGYNSCAVSNLWERMSKDEGPQNELDNMMRTHPYSEKRSICCRQHILNNYNYSCPN